MDQETIKRVEVYIGALEKAKAAVKEKKTLETIDEMIEYFEGYIHL